MKTAPTERSNSPQIISRPTPSAMIPSGGIARIRIRMLAGCVNRKSLGYSSEMMTQTARNTRNTMMTLPAGCARNRSRMLAPA